METEVQHTGTFNANPIVIAACNATLKELEKPGIYDHMTQLMNKVTKGINDFADRKEIKLFCRGEGAIWQLAFDITERLNDFRDTFNVNKKVYQHFRTESLKEGIHYLSHRGRMYLSAVHSNEDIEKTLSAFEKVSNTLKL
jgi:glutamate-1-semialdehyde 2,1-aminomutase